MPQVRVWPRGRLVYNAEAAEAIGYLADGFRAGGGGAKRSNCSQMSRKCAMREETDVEQVRREGGGLPSSSRGVGVGNTSLKVFWLVVKEG
jgi:hypothetical protein